MKSWSKVALAGGLWLCASPASAAMVSLEGEFRENVPRTDDYTISFTSDDPRISIRSILYDLGTANAAVVFAPDEAPFAVASEGGTGFDGLFGFDAQGPTTLSLSFDDFGTGETFAFTVETGPDRVLGDDFAGTTLTFVTNTGESFSGTFDRFANFRATVEIDGETAVPEPASALLFGLALLVRFSRRRS